MAALPLLPLIGEAATLAAEGASEAAIIDQLGAKFSNAIAAQVAAQVSSYLISHADEIIDTAFGPGTAKEFHKNLNKNVSEIEDFLSDFESGRPFGTSQAERFKNKMTSERQEAERQKRLENEILQNQINKNLADLYRKEHEAGGSCSCSEQLENTTKGPTIDDPEKGSGIIIIDPRAKTDNPKGESLLPKIEHLEQNSGDYGSRTAEFVVNLMLDSLDGSNKMSDMLMKKPELYTVAKHYLSWAKTQKNVPKSKEEIYKTYNGRSLNPTDVFRLQNEKGTYYAIYDEVKDLKVYTGRAAPRGLSDAQLIGLGYTPPLYDTWMGPNSPNNQAPKTLVGLFSFLHDLGYHEKGWFDEYSDTLYISRLSQNIDRMGFIEAQYARFGMSWFSTIGLALAKVKGSMKDPVNNDDPNSDDFFTYLHNTATGTPTVSQEPSDTVGSYIEYNTDKMNQKIISRKNFYKSFKDKVDDLFEQNAPKLDETFSTKGNFSRNPIAQFIRNLPVVEFTE